MIGEENEHTDAEHNSREEQEQQVHVAQPLRVANALQVQHQNKTMP